MNKNENIKICIPGNDYTYKVDIGEKNSIGSLANLLNNYSEENVYLITNDTIHPLYSDFIEILVPEKFKVFMLILPDGEKYKQLETVSRIHDFFIKNNANRKSIAIAFGGGVIGDMVGFAAATFMRGIRYVQIPTTLLSQVDSSVGGKTGVNHPSGKNLIGAFKQPYQTIIDVSFLDSLSQREFNAGYAELIKHGFIRDFALLDLLKTKTTHELKLDKKMLIEAISISCNIKAKVVEADEKESGIRAILNFGHTLGHFFETITNYDQYLHGEAVLAGMDFAAWWSWHHHYLPKEEYIEVHESLQQLGIKLQLPLYTKDQFLEIIGHDKKANSQGIRFIGLVSRGAAKIFEGILSEELWVDFQIYLKSNALICA